MMKSATGTAKDPLAKTLDQLVDAVAAQGEPSFRDLVQVAGLDPAKDFVGASLRGLDVRDEDMSGFNFSHADLTGADFRRAKIVGTRFTGADLTGTIGLPDLPKSRVESGQPLKTFAEAIAAQQRPARRPALAEHLLIYPIAPNPYDPSAIMDSDWAREHAGIPRFYVGGVHWFLHVTQLSMAKIAAYRNQAPIEAKKAGWNAMPGTPLEMVEALRAYWGAIARQQFYSIAGACAVNFPKAALFLLACELALTDLIYSSDDSVSDRISIPKHITSGEYIYQHMAIVPSCWNINDFNSCYYTNNFAEKLGLLRKLADYAGQSESNVLSELASGHTVTFATAEKIQEFCLHTSSGCGPVGRIRSRAGRILGSKKAADLSMSSFKLFRNETQTKAAC